MTITIKVLIYNDTNPQNRHSTSNRLDRPSVLAFLLYEAASSADRFSNIWGIFFINCQRCHNIVRVSNRSVSWTNQWVTLRPNVTKASFSYRTWISIWLQLFSDLRIATVLKALVCSGPVLKQQEMFKWRLVHMQIYAIVWNLESTTNDRNVSSACWT